MQGLVDLTVGHGDMIVFFFLITFFLQKLAHVRIGPTCDPLVYLMHAARVRSVLFWVCIVEVVL
jgi:hypothetical protein